MESEVTFDIFDENQRPTQADDTQSLRNELITLAEKHEIKHTVVYIKKASHSALEKIKSEYERKQLEETNEYLTETLMGKLSEFMEGVNMIDDAKSMEEELVHNKMVKRDLKNILGCGVSIVGKHMYNRKTDPEPATEE